MGAYHARKQFEDNLTRFGKDPEKHNLYAGLANLAEELEALRRDVQEIGKAVNQLRSR